MALLAPFILTYTHSVFTGKTVEVNSEENSSAFKIPEVAIEQGLPVQLAATEDLGLYLYRNSLTRNHMMTYLDKLTESTEITDIILRNANKNNIPVSLAFSLAFAESSYNPKAINRNTNSIDRGLFQLNSKSFPDLKESDFFNPEINARYGLSYLATCIEKGGNEIVGLAMYNAGSGRVTGSGTPKMTLDYIAKIMDYKRDIDAFIMDSMVTEKSLVDTGNKIKDVRYVLNTEGFKSR